MLETLKTSHFACSTEYQLVCQQVSELRKEKRFPPSLLGHRGFPGSLPKRDKGEGLRQGIPSSLRSGTGGSPGSFTGSLPASSQPISCNGMSPGTRGSPRGSAIPGFLPSQDLWTALLGPQSSSRSLLRVSRPVHGQPAAHGVPSWASSRPLPSAPSPRGYLLRRQLHMQGPRGRTGRQRGGRARGRRGDRSPDRR